MAKLERHHREVAGVADPLLPQKYVANVVAVAIFTSVNGVEQVHYYQPCQSMKDAPWLTGGRGSRCQL